MSFFEVLHFEIAQKLQNLKISLIFSSFLVDFKFLLIFADLLNKTKDWALVHERESLLFLI